MDDSEIIELFWARSEDAVAAVSEKYSKRCYGVAYNILKNREDAEECVNDTLARAWNAIPPARPGSLPAFLMKIARNLSFDRYKLLRAEKRGSGEFAAALSELGECVPDAAAELDGIIESSVITSALNAFLAELKPGARLVFMRRYWYSDGVDEIAASCGMTVAKVKSILFRARNKLKVNLEKEGIAL
ncbi:MAG: sigma-70 family RNA polymerase sigma factor [Oscillospiraceae bacterium]|jgi:RNA polymerase sigma-70 factor (ECF subfamily)|nr:sigma-70 family RNA polymerase sigma factor [Oscillospiraceae bacterium]